MRYFEDEISGIDGSTATFVGYCLDNSSEIDPNRKRPSVLVIPGGGYEMTSDREAEPIAMQFLAAGFNAFVLRYSVKPSIFPVALLEAAEAMRRIRTHADEWHCDADAIAVIGFSAGGHLAANLATSASDDVLAAHGYDADAVRPNGLMLAYPVVTSGPLAHRGSFDALLGDRKADTARAAGDKRRAAGGILRFVHVLFLILGVFGNECIEGSRILDAGTGRLAVDAFDKVRQPPAEADLGEHGSTLID